MTMLLPSPDASAPAVPAQGGTLTFRRLAVQDADALIALSVGVWWMETRPRDVVIAVLSSTSTTVYGLFDSGALVATAALLSDGLTKAVLIDVAVAETRRGEGLGDLVVSRTLEHAPPGADAMLWCRSELTGFYASHGFSVDDAYTLMLRRAPRAARG